MKRSPSLRELLRIGVRSLERSARILSAHPDTMLLLSHATGIRREDILADPCRPVGRSQAARFLWSIRSRSRLQPLQHLLGEQEFYGRSFRVGPAVLIPRPETETVVQEALDSLSLRFPPDSRERPRVLDLGTGSGCIAISVACEREDAILVATDISPEALAVARENARLQGVAARIDFRQGDLFLPLPGERFHLILSNPPYVPTGDPELSPEVARFEPPVALFAGDTGLQMYRRIFAEAAAHLVEEGELVVEIGYGQSALVPQLAEEFGWRLLDTIKDLARIDRVLRFNR